MSFYEISEMKGMGFKSLGKNVKISRKSSIYNPELISIGNNSRVDDFCVLSGNLSIGSYVHIAAGCLIAGGTKGVELCSFSGLAYGVKVFSQSDDYSGASMTNPTVPDKYKKVLMKKVLIGRHVIIGAGSTIMPGVDIGEGCSVGAHSLVRKSTEPWGIYLGNPAKKIKSRKQDILILERSLLDEVDNDTL